MIFFEQFFRICYTFHAMDAKTRFVDLFVQLIAFVPLHTAFGAQWGVQVANREVLGVKHKLMPKC